MTPESIQALENAIAAAEAVDSDPNATVADIQAAIDAIDDAINNLMLKQITPKDDSTIVVDRDTVYTYLVGLDVTANTAADVQTALKNDNTTIIITTADGTEIGDSDRVGTGFIVKCVNANDHSIVYEVATVVLYGDVNGDGLVDNVDRGLLKQDAYFDGTNIEAGTVYYYAADLDGDTVLDGFDVYYQNVIMTIPENYNQSLIIFK